MQLSVLVISLLETAILFLASGHPVNRGKDGEPKVEMMNQDTQKGAVHMYPVNATASAGLRQEGDLKFAKEDKNVNGEDVNLDIEKAKKLEKLPEEKLKPVDHIDGVRMEQDGHVNKDFHKEMFLGEVHEEFETETFDEAEDKLKEIVSQADTDKDGVLSKKEMESWILKNMKQHFEVAIKENDHIFKHLDPDGKGFVTWKEYYLHFLLSRGFEVKKAVQHVKDYDDDLTIDHDELLLADKDQLVSYKFKWTDADKQPTDNQLSKEEFMVFRHPEQSKASLQMMVENVLNSIDSNKDGMVSMDEYAALPPGEVEGKEFEEMDKKWQEERRREFRTIMDINHDGQVTSEELKRYLDPTNPIQAKIETDSLIYLMDDNRDAKLSMNEILAHSEIFITSKLANFGANVHDEF